MDNKGTKKQKLLQTRTVKFENAASTLFLGFFVV
jgi:hypothetical protein